MSFAVTDPPYYRLTVLAPRARVNVALPADLPVAELVPMVLELVGEPAPGRPPHPWRLFTADGRALPAGPALPELGVREGDLLRIAPAGSAPAPPLFDDPVEVLAVSGRSEGVDDRRFPSIAIPLLGGASAALLVGWPTPAVLDLPDVPIEPVSRSVLVLVAALAALVALAGASWLVHHAATRPPASAPPIEAPPTDRADLPDGHPPSSVPTPPAAIAAALAAVPLVAAAGWLAWPEAPDPSRVLVTAVAVGGAAAAAQAALRRVHPVLVGVVVAAAPTAVAALATTYVALPPTAAAVGAGAIALVAGPLLPRVALWLSGLPRPLVPGDAEELVAADHGPDLLPPAELAVRAGLARSYLAGLVGGCAVVAGVAALPAATVVGWTGPALAAITVALLGLRARSFVDPGPARALAGSALLAGIGLAAVVAWSGVPWARPAAAVGLLLAAAALGCAGSRGVTAGSPVRRRAVDLGEGLLTALVLPLALGALDLYRTVRGM
jgi:hypothetical protein